MQLFAQSEAVPGDGTETAAETAGEETAVEEENTLREENGDKTEPETEKSVAEDLGEEEKRDIKADINALKAMSDTFEQFRLNAETDGIIADWEKDAEALKELYPDFDLLKTLKNEEAAQLIKAGVPLKRAYEAVNLERIVSSAMRYAALSAGKRAAQAIADGNARPGENPVLDRASSVKRTDVGSLTEKDIMRILGEVSRGAKITFR